MFLLQTDNVWICFPTLMRIIYSRETFRRSGVPHQGEADVWEMTVSFKIYLNWTSLEGRRWWSHSLPRNGAVNRNKDRCFDHLWYKAVRVLVVTDAPEWKSMSGFFFFFFTPPIANLEHTTGVVLTWGRRKWWKLWHQTRFITQHVTRSPSFIFCSLTFFFYRLAVSAAFTRITFCRVSLRAFILAFKPNAGMFNLFYSSRTKCTCKWFGKEPLTCV